MCELCVIRAFMHNCLWLTSQGVAVLGAVSLCLPLHSIWPALLMTATSTVDRRRHTVSKHTDTLLHMTVGLLVHIIFFYYLNITKCQCQACSITVFQARYMQKQYLYCDGFSVCICNNRCINMRIDPR